MRDIVWPIMDPIRTFQRKHENRTRNRLVRRNIAMSHEVTHMDNGRGLGARAQNIGQLARGYYQSLLYQCHPEHREVKVLVANYRKGSDVIGSKMSLLYQNSTARCRSTPDGQSAAFRET